MKRLTTDEPKDNIQAALNLFYIKDHETWVRGGGPGPEYPDVSLFDYTREIIKTHIPDVELPSDNDDFSMMMAEWLLDGPENAEGVVAMLYTAAWAFAELRHRLAAYEDTGLEPKEIKNALDANDIRPGLTLSAEQILELEKAKQEGRLVVVPCKVGDTVYVIDWYLDCDIDGFKVCDDYEKEGDRACGYCHHNYVKKFIREKKYENQMLDEIGKTVFLARKEAERALGGEHA